MPSLICRTLAIASLAAILPAAQAMADSNILSILQEGGGNTLTVDQSQASDSKVGGLSISNTLDSLSLTGQLDAGALGTSNGTMITSGSRQMDVLRATSKAELPAVQDGSNNSATVTLSGSNGFVGLLQQSPLNGTGNRATVNVSGNGQALVGQLGGNNEAKAILGAGASQAAILQKGNGNFADLSVTGSNASGQINQIGNGLNNSLSVTGANTSAALIANGVSNGTSTPVTVQSNGASVTITQSKM